MFKRAIVFTFIIAATSFQGFSQTQDLDKNMDKALEDLSIMLDTLDLNALFNFDFTKQLDEIKPDAKQMESMEEMLQQSIKMMQEIDLSAFEQMFQQFEGQFEGFKGFEDLEKLMPQLPEDLQTPEKKEKAKDAPAKKKL